MTSRKFTKTDKVFWHNSVQFGQDTWFELMKTKDKDDPAFKPIKTRFQIILRYKLRFWHLYKTLWLRTCTYFESKVRSPNTRDYGQSLSVSITVRQLHTRVLCCFNLDVLQSILIGLEQNITKRWHFHCIFNWFQLHLLKAVLQKERFPLIVHCQWRF